MIWIYFALIFPMPTFDSWQSSAGYVTGLSLLSFNQSDTIVVMLCWWCFTQLILINLLFLEMVVRNRQCICTSDVEICETRIEFHRGTDFGLQINDKTFCFLFSLSFLCYALNLMTTSGQLECCLSSNSPSTLSGQRLCWTHAGIFQVTGPKSLWGMTEIYQLVGLTLNLMCVLIVF